MRRLPAVVWAAARKPAADERRSTGPTRRTHRATSHGPSSARATMSRIAAPAEAPTAASPRTVRGTVEIETPAAAKTIPVMTRGRPIGPGPVDDSRSASMGSRRAGRRAAMRAAPQAEPSTSTSALMAGNGLSARAKSPGITPPATNADCSADDSRYPGTIPSSAATTATVSTSLAMRECTCDEVAPTARSRAYSRRRACTDSDSVPATMNRATRMQVPTNALPVAMSRVRAAAESRNSTSPRASPVRATRSGNASRIALATCSGSPSTNTPSACGAPPCGSRSRMRSSVRNTGTARSGSASAVTRPTTV